ncbi:MAG TPA: THUMP domain-containing protein [Myxococcales bacterium]|jgi:tRNA(Ser,Leu) C12 N-acetylase TAN1
MRDWNVVITLRGQMARALRQLRRLSLGPVSVSRFLDVLVMKADDPHAVLRALDEKVAQEPQQHAFLSHVFPCDQTFTFRSPEEFEAKAQEDATRYAGALAGKSFHVRIHRRGFKGRLSTKDEERRLGEFLYERLEKAGTPARVSFEDPDAVVLVETVGTQAGMALLGREELGHSRLLRAD